MDDKRRELEKQKESLKKKEEAFELLKNNKTDDAQAKLAEDSHLLSYFSKFRINQETGLIIPVIGEPRFLINYNISYENSISEDLDKLREKFERKEDLYLQKENRNKIEMFTFILAFGVLLTGAYYMHEIISSYINAPTRHQIIASGIFFAIYLFLIIYVVNIFYLDKKHEKWSFIEKIVSYMIISLVLSASIMYVVYETNSFFPNEGFPSPYVEIENNLTSISEKLYEQNSILNELTNNNGEASSKISIIRTNQQYINSR